ncbi:hypothetical protein ADJ79_11970 [Ottowia sp. oral taxon 894]|nr:hypothetical protein ADJ79_11970 [Ottowia sp. oral taxon 894]
MVIYFWQVSSPEWQTCLSAPALACAKARGRPARVKRASVADGIKNRSEFSAIKRAFAHV